MLMNMKDLLAVAHKNYFAVPAFNISSNMLLSGVIQASEEKQSPVILAIHPDELAFVRPSFINRRLKKRSTPPFRSASIWITAPQWRNYGSHPVRLHLGDDGRFHVAARAKYRSLQKGRGTGACGQCFGRRRVRHHRHDRPRSGSRYRRNYLYQSR